MQIIEIYANIEGFIGCYMKLPVSIAESIENIFDRYSEVEVLTIDGGDPEFVIGDVTVDVLIMSENFTEEYDDEYVNVLKDMHDKQTNLLYLNNKKTNLIESCLMYIVFDIIKNIEDYNIQVEGKTVSLHSKTENKEVVFSHTFKSELSYSKFQGQDWLFVEHNNDMNDMMEFITKYEDFIEETDEDDNSNEDE